ncbi:LOW QUALITY PROTEIN: hypothetical protein TorRG33x02_268410, partial [Trema orientale]
LVVTHEASLKLLNKRVHRWISRVEQKNLLSGDYGLDVLQSMGTTVAGPESGGLGRAAPSASWRACRPPLPGLTRLSRTGAMAVPRFPSYGGPNRLRRVGLGRGDRPPRVRGPIWACEEDDPSSQWLASPNWGWFL